MRFQPEHLNIRSYGEGAVCLKDGHRVKNFLKKQAQTTRIGLDIFSNPFFIYQNIP